MSDPTTEADIVASPAAWPASETMPDAPAAASAALAATPGAPAEYPVPVHPSHVAILSIFIAGVRKLLDELETLLGLK